MALDLVICRRAVDAIDKDRGRPSRLPDQPLQGVVVGSPIYHPLGLAYLRAGKGARGQDMDLRAQRKSALQRHGDRGARLVPMLLAAGRHVGQFADDDEAGHGFGAVDDEEEVLRPQGRLGEDDRLDLARVDVDTADDQHVVSTADYPRHADQGPAAHARARVDGGDVAGPVPKDGHRFPRQRGEDQLPVGARRHGRARGGVDDLDQEMIFIHMKGAGHAVSG